MNITTTHVGMAIWTILTNASIVVQLVMLMLLGASLISWTMIF